MVSGALIHNTLVDGADAAGYSSATAHIHPSFTASDCCWLHWDICTYVYMHTSCVLFRRARRQTSKVSSTKVPDRPADPVHSLSLQLPPSLARGVISVMASSN